MDEDDNSLPWLHLAVSSAEFEFSVTSMVATNRESTDSRGHSLYVAWMHGNTKLKSLACKRYVGVTLLCVGTANYKQKQQRQSIIFNYSLLIDSGKHSQSDSNDEPSVHVYNQGASCTTSKAKASSNTTL